MLLSNMLKEVIIVANDVFLTWITVPQHVGVGYCTSSAKLSLKVVTVPEDHMEKDMERGSII